MKYDQAGEIRCPRNRKFKTNETLLGKLPTKLPSNLEVTFRAICEARLLGDSKMSLNEYINIMHEPCCEEFVFRIDVLQTDKEDEGDSQ